jgi:hypothetical protein
MVYTAHVCGLPFSQYLRGAYLRPAIVLFLLTTAALGTKILFKPTSILTLVGTGGVLALIFAILCWFIAFDTTDRAMLHRILSLGSSPLVSTSEFLGHLRRTEHRPNRDRDKHA